MRFYESDGKTWKCKLCGAKVKQWKMIRKHIIGLHYCTALKVLKKEVNTPRMRECEKLLLILKWNPNILKRVFKVRRCVDRDGVCKAIFKCRFCDFTYRFRHHEDLYPILRHVYIEVISGSIRDVRFKPRPPKITALGRRV